MKSGSRRMINVLFKPIMRSISKRNFGRLYRKDGVKTMLCMARCNITFKYVVKENRVSIVLGGK